MVLLPNHYCSFLLRIKAEKRARQILEERRRLSQQQQQQQQQQGQEQQGSGAPPAGNGGQPPSLSGLALLKSRFSGGSFQK